MARPTCIEAARQRLRPAVPVLDEAQERQQLGWLTTADLRAELARLGQDRLRATRREQLALDELARRPCGAAGGGG
jgi:hypothetical protein